MISVIIPTYEEAVALRATLDSVAENRTNKEVIVVDAGSVDSTSELAHGNASLVLFSPRRQRAYQMNLGAQHARGAILLFLHADTVLPASALDQIELSLTKDGIVGGGFSRRYDSNSRFLKATCVLASLRTRWTGWFLGDQAIFVRRAVFAKLGGYRELDLFEDLDFSRRMTRMGQVVTLSPSVISSSRRFQRRGAVRTTVSDLWLTARYLMGADPGTLAKWTRLHGEKPMQSIPSAAMRPESRTNGVATVNAEARER
jgi:rSAM/selenodomain-associated transferase 2